MEIETSRRTLLTSATVAMIALPVVGCGTSTPATVLPAVIAFIQSAMLQACAIIPSAVSIATVVADLFPAAAGVATITEALANQIVAALCPAPATGAAHMFKLKSGAVAQLHGFHVVDGHLVEF